MLAFARACLLVVCLIGHATACSAVDDDRPELRNAESATAQKAFLEFLEYVNVEDWRLAEIAARSYREAVRSELGEHSAAYAEALNNLATVHFWQHKHQDAISEAVDAVTIEVRIFGSGHADPQRAFDTLAAALTQYCEATSTADWAQALEHVLGPDDPRLFHVMGLLGVQMAQRGSPHALSLLQRASEIGDTIRAADDLDAAAIRSNLGTAYNAVERYSDAVPVLRHALQVNEEKFATGAISAVVLDATTWNLAFALAKIGQLSDATLLFEPALALEEQALGLESADVAETLENLEALYRRQDRNADADASRERALSIRRRVWEHDNPGARQTIVGDLRIGVLPGSSSEAVSLNRRLEEYTSARQWSEALETATKLAEVTRRDDGEASESYLQSLGKLASIYIEQGRLTNATHLNEQILDILYKTFGRNDPRVAGALQGLAILYQDQGRSSDAIDILKRARDITYAAQGKENVDVLLRLGSAYRETGQIQAAILVLKQALIAQQQVAGPDDVSVAPLLNNLANALSAQNRHSEALGLQKRALSIRRRKLGNEHPDTAESLNNLAAVYYQSQRHSDARRLFEEALAIRETILGAHDKDIATTLNNLSILDLDKGKFYDAWLRSRRAAEIMARSMQESEGITSSERAIFLHLVESTYQLSQQEKARTRFLLTEAFVANQFAQQSLAAAAIEQMASRLSKGGNPVLGRLLRQRQDVMARLRVLGTELLKSVSAAPELYNAVAENDIRAQQNSADGQLAQITASLERDFPGAAALTSSKPLSIVGSQRLLREGEALITFATLRHDNVAIWVITQTRAEWRELKISRDNVDQAVTALRANLNPQQSALGKGRQGIGLSRLPTPKATWDFGAAHELYQGLLGPVADLIKDKKHLIIVPDGPLTALPFQVLTEEAPDPKLTGGDAYRQAAWLIKRHAVSVLPSVASLKALRKGAEGSRAEQGFIGFGDPRFGPCPPEQTPVVAASALPATAEGTSKSATTAMATAPGATAASVVAAAASSVSQGTTDTRGYASFFRGTAADGAMLCQLQPLPESADELKAIARSLGVPESEIKVQEAATETAVKQAPLDRYRIVHFATHGLVAGEITGLGEPGLALTVPKTPSTEDDGLLTASEVAQLKLDADWVILSACNTAAGDKPGAEALSGLARAFFYAGARALLVSHWPVNSKAAEELTTGTIRALEENPKIGRAEALRIAMLELIEKGNDSQVHPSYWAPFTVVGEGGAMR